MTADRLAQLSIEPFQESFWSDTWAILEPVFSEGETYAYPVNIDEADAHYEWVEKPDATFVARLDGRLVGTYFLKTNQPGQGSHVCNCGYVVSPIARGKGLAAEMCRHSQEQAVVMGYRAMQFNFVAATNTVAVALWQRLGFETVGTLPGAFCSPSSGYVDAYVMYKHLP